MKSFGADTLQQASGRVNRGADSPEPFGVLLGLLILPVSLLLTMQAARRIRAAEVALLGRLETVLGPLWVWLALGDAPPADVVAAGALIVAVTTAHSITAIRADARAVEPGETVVASADVVDVEAKHVAAPPIIEVSAASNDEAGIEVDRAQVERRRTVGRIALLPASEGECRGRLETKLAGPGAIVPSCAITGILAGGSAVAISETTRPTTAIVSACDFRTLAESRTCWEMRGLVSPLPHERW